MNLHINFLLESEERSASRISRKFLVRATAVFTALLFLSLIVLVLAGARSAELARLVAEQEKKQLEGDFRQVTELQRELAGLQELTNAIAVWAQTRPDWPSLLSVIQGIVPANIQLTRLTASENIMVVDNTPTRSVILYLQGKAAGAHSEIDVQELEKSLREKPPFNEIMEFAQVKQFQAAHIAGQENLRVFDIECRFKTLKLFQPARVPDVKQNNKK